MSTVYQENMHKAGVSESERATEGDEYMRAGINDVLGLGEVRSKLVQPSTGCINVLSKLEAERW